MPTPKARLYWIDHLRTLVIVLVVNLHCCVTYSHVGGWFINSEDQPSLLSTLIFGLWEAHLQSFFMGIMFFFAGYFAWGSLRRKGPAAFVGERFIRLGLPTLLFMLVIDPFVIAGINPWHDPHIPGFVKYFQFNLRSGHFVRGSGPMWFAFALLVFSLVWAFWRALRGRPEAGAMGEAPAPSGRAILLFALVLGLGSFLVRLVAPIGENVINMQLCFFVQYIAAFAVGLAAARHGWLVALAASPQARRAGWLAVIGGPILFVLLVVGGVGRNLGVVTGGWRWQAACYAFWEQATGVGLSLGLMALFSRRMNHEGPFLRWLADRSFGVYFIHTPILVALYLVLLPLGWPAWPNALLMTAIALPVAFVCADLLHRTPAIGKIL